ncbi:MAG: DoxX family protein [Bacteroidota bacterium]|nr:DoxX family protein [Bacteroidota bacterium]
MKSILTTRSNDWAPLIGRLALGVMVFTHGAQKLLGWFGGYGFKGTMGFMTGAMHLPWIIGFLVIIIEFFGGLFLLLGLITRIAALAVTLSFLGVVLKVHLANGFFMNWGMAAGKGEGVEFFILLFGLSLGLLITGGGKASIDSIWSPSSLEN